MGEPGFYCAATGGVPMLVRLLLDGAQVGSRGRHGETSLFVTVRYRDASVPKCMIGHGADIGGPRTSILASHHLFPLSESMQSSRCESPLRKESEAPDIPNAASLMALHRTVFDSGPFESPLALLGTRLNLNVRNCNG